MSCIWCTKHTVYNASSNTSVHLPNRQAILPHLLLASSTSAFGLQILLAVGACQILVHAQRSAVLFSSYLILLFLSDHFSFSCARHVSALFLSGDMMTSVVIYLPTGWQFFLSIFARCNAPSHSLLVVWPNDDVIDDLLSFCRVILFFPHFATTRCFSPLRDFFCHHAMEHASYDDALDFS